MAAPMATHAENTSALLLSILKSTEDNSIVRRSDMLDVVIQSSSELSLFHKEGTGVSDLASYVNKCLTVSSTRLVGLALLEPLIAQISAQQFQQHCMSWIRLLTQIIQPYSNIPHVRLAAALVPRLLSKASRHPDISREVASSLVHPLVENALQLKDERLAFSLEVLDGCMRFFPGPCGPMRNRLVNHVTYILGDEQNNSSVELACRCFALLPSLGGGGTGGVLHQEAWSYYARKLMNTLAQVLSELYKDHKCGVMPPSQEDPILPLPEVTPEEQERTFTLAKQTRRLLDALTELLQNDFPVTVIIPHKDIISMVCSVLAVNGRVLSLNGSLQASYLLMTVSNLHSAALKVLEALINRCGRHLLGNARTINLLLLQTLNWTAALDDTSTSQFRSLRSEVYRCCGTWLTSLGASAYMGENSAKLVAHIVRDAQLQKTKKQDESSKLDPTGAEDAGQPKKKKQKKYHQWRVQPVGGWGNKQEGDQCMEQLCAEALCVLRKLFFACGSRLKWTVHRNVHSLVIKTLLQCQNKLSLASPAYQSSVCRRELYHALMACILVPSPHWAAPLQSSVHIFSQGRLDLDIKVRQFCMESAAVLENLVHPRSPQVSCHPLTPPPESEGGTLDLSSVIFPGSRISLAQSQGISPWRSETGGTWGQIDASDGFNGGVDSSWIAGERGRKTGEMGTADEVVVGHQGSQQVGASAGGSRGEDGHVGQEVGSPERGTAVAEREHENTSQGTGVSQEKNGTAGDVVDDDQKGKESDDSGSADDDGDDDVELEDVDMDDDDEEGDVAVTVSDTDGTKEGGMADQQEGNQGGQEVGQKEKGNTGDDGGSGSEVRDDDVELTVGEQEETTSDNVDDTAGKTGEASVAEMLASFSAEGPDD